jgi:hypothetical protein
MGREIPTHIFSLFYSVLSGLGVAVPAVDRFIATRLKGNFRLFTALCAGSRVHLAGTSIPIAAAVTVSFGFPGHPAGRTTFGLIGEAFRCKKFLLLSSKSEGSATVGTLKGFLGVSHFVE